MDRASLHTDGKLLVYYSDGCSHCLVFVLWIRAGVHTRKHCRSGCFYQEPSQYWTNYTLAQLNQEELVVFNQNMKQHFILFRQYLVVFQEQNIVFNQNCVVLNQKCVVSSQCCVGFTQDLPPFCCLYPVVYVYPTFYCFYPTMYNFY